MQTINVWQIRWPDVKSDKSLNIRLRVLAFCRSRKEAKDREGKERSGEERENTRLSGRSVRRDAVEERKRGHLWHGINSYLLRERGRERFGRDSRAPGGGRLDSTQLATLEINSLREPSEALKLSEKYTCVSISSGSENSPQASASALQYSPVLTKLTECVCCC